MISFDPHTQSSNEKSNDTIPTDAKRALYERQVTLLNTFLSRGAITRAQYDKSLADLNEKMGFSKSQNP